MRAVTLQPAAGAQGELTGILMIRAYHRARGDTDRDEVLVPDSSHGTNPATASMAGFRTITIPSAAGRRRRRRRVPGGARAADGRGHDHEPIDARACSRRASASCSSAVHEAGALAYMDGANLNAILGRFKPGEAGFDVMHFNVHKTFSTPHGGGGPGAGPVGVGERAPPVPADPARPARADDGTFRLERPDERPTSIGRLRSFVGNTGVLVRAYAYIRAHGAYGPARGQRRRRPRRELPEGTAWATPTTSRTTAPASTSSSPRRPRSRRETGVRTLDIAKRLIDFGFHPPTIYFPLIVEEGMLIEPTETESLETLDAFADALIAIAAEAAAGPGRSSRRPAHAPRSGASTRPPRPASRTCAGGRWPARRRPARTDRHAGRRRRFATPDVDPHERSLG